MVLPASCLVAQTDPVRVTISFDRPTASPGDSIRATIVATNTSHRAASIRGQRLVFSERIPMPRVAGSYRVVGNLTTEPVRTASAQVSVQ